MYAAPSAQSESGASAGHGGSGGGAGGLGGALYVQLMNGVVSVPAKPTLKWPVLCSLGGRRTSATLDGATLRKYSSPRRSSDWRLSRLSAAPGPTSMASALSAAVGCSSLALGAADASKAAAAAATT